MSWDGFDEETVLARRVARWLHEHGVPVESNPFSTPPPGAVKGWLINYWWAEAIKNDPDVPRDHVKDWLLDESGWEHW